MPRSSFAAVHPVVEAQQRRLQRVHSALCRTASAWRRRQTEGGGQWEWGVSGSLQSSVLVAPLLTSSIDIDEACCVFRPLSAFACAAPGPASAPTFFDDGPP